MKAKALDRDLQIPDSAFRVTNASPNLYQILQKLEHCASENAEALHDHLKQLKRIIKRFGIDPNSREVVTIVVSFFTGQLGNWAVVHAGDIFKFNSVDALTAYVRVSFSSEDLEGEIFIC